MKRFNRTRKATERARTLRTYATDVENKLWWHLRNKQMEGESFRRQHPMGPYFVDFYCARIKLVIELDGSQHAERTEEDDARTRFLAAAKGVRVVRFWNSDIIENLEGVLFAIQQSILERRRDLTLTRSALRSDLPLSGGGKVKPI